MGDVISLTASGIQQSAISIPTHRFRVASETVHGSRPLKHKHLSIATLEDDVARLNADC
jgi:hypothetical protein